VAAILQRVELLSTQSIETQYQPKTAKQRECPHPHLCSLGWQAEAAEPRLFLSPLEEEPREIVGEKGTRIYTTRAEAHQDLAHQ
jgi:hypothetical protein